MPNSRLEVSFLIDKLYYFHTEEGDRQIAANDKQRAENDKKIHGGTWYVAGLRDDGRITAAQARVLLRGFRAQRRLNSSKQRLINAKAN